MVTMLFLTGFGCAVVVGLLVVPFVLGVDMAERLGFSAARWGAVTVVGLALALYVAFQVVQSWPRPLFVLVPVLAWSGPAVLALLDATQTRLGGTQGAHEL
jgi:hypothetical protein